MLIDKIVQRIGLKINWNLLLKAAPVIALAAVIIKIINEIEKPKPIFYFPPKPQVPKKRKDFSEATKKATILKQWNVCNMCKKSPELWEFHHKDGNRSNNTASNCEGLCPLCHAKKTRKKKFF